METAHKFGGGWTEEKLTRIKKYLEAYMQIFSQNERASFFETIYLDAFAGTGSRAAKEAGPLLELIPELAEEDTQQFYKGSARIALELANPFDRYVFIESAAAHVSELEKLRAEYPQVSRSINIHQANANEFLLDWCARTHWKTTRAVVFLDPYGMQVDWATIEAIAKTQAIDMWFLFPLGSSVNRLLTKKAPPPEEWAKALTRALGTEEWRDAFYQKRVQPNLFGELIEIEEKSADWDAIARFVINRLKGSFAGVAENPLFLYNRTGVPIFMLCFAAGNPKGAAIATRIASHLLKPKKPK
jgi:three-Cys-motif partner protein